MLIRSRILSPLDLMSTFDRAQDGHLDKKEFMTMMKRLVHNELAWYGNESEDLEEDDERAADANSGPASAKSAVIQLWPSFAKDDNIMTLEELHKWLVAGWREAKLEFEQEHGQEDESGQFWIPQQAQVDTKPPTEPSAEPAQVPAEASLLASPAAQAVAMEARAIVARQRPLVKPIKICIPTNNAGWALRQRLSVQRWLFSPEVPPKLSSEFHITPAGQAKWDKLAVPRSPLPPIRRSVYTAPGQRVGTASSLVQSSSAPGFLGETEKYWEPLSAARRGRGGGKAPLRQMAPLDERSTSHVTSRASTLLS